MAKKEAPFDLEQKQSLEEILQSRDLYEKNREQTSKLTTELEAARSELSNIHEKMAVISKDLESKNLELSTLKVTLEKELELKTTLSRQVDDLQKRLSSVESNEHTARESLATTVSQKDGIISSKDALLVEKDKIIASKDEQVQQLNKKIEELSEKLQAGLTRVDQVQGEIIAFQKSTEELRLKERDWQTKFNELHEKHEKIKSRLRDSGDSVLGTTMELEKTNREIQQRDEIIQQKDAEIEILKGKLGSILTGTSGVVTTQDKLSELFKQKVKETQRSVRFCLPRLALVESIGLLPTLQGFPRTTVVNIASDIRATDEHIVLDLKARGVVFTQYDAKDRWVLNRDGEDVILALERNERNVIGFYSNEPKIVTMLNSAIMEPWVRGIKI